MQRRASSDAKKATAAAFYRLLRRITNVEIPVDTGDFRLMGPRAVAAFRSLPERNRFIRGLVSWIGFPQIAVRYRRHARQAGETKYPLRKMLRFASDAITGFSYLPLQIATYMGFISAGLSILAIPIVIYLRFTGSQAFFGQATTLIAVLFLGGVQLISLGVLGEYIGRLYDEAKGRPLYIVREAPGED